VSAGVTTVFAFAFSATSLSPQPVKQGLLHRVASNCNLSVNNGTFILGGGGCDSRVQPWQAKLK